MGEENELGSKISIYGYLEDSRSEALEGVEESRQMYEIPRGVAVERGWAGEVLRSPLLQNQRWIQISVAESVPQTPRCASPAT